MSETAHLSGQTSLSSTQPAVGDLSSIDNLEFDSILARGYKEGKLPLFVLGSGISAGKVPFLSQMTVALIAMLQGKEYGDLNADIRSCLLTKGELIKGRTATRADAAEFFSLLQEPEATEGTISKLWDKFCEKLLYEGITVDDVNFDGLLQLKMTTDAHRSLAFMASLGDCHILNLNYDPLLFLGMKEIRAAYEDRQNLNFIALHSARDISHYYCSRSRQFQPAVTNARGDVFFARCTNPLCPQCGRDENIDYAPTKSSWQDYRVCPACHLLNSLTIRLSFPSYETKERVVAPVLNLYRHYVANRTSALITVGLSGQWDPHLLDILFRWSFEYRIPLLDVRRKTNVDGDDAFEQFGRRFFPGVMVDPDFDTAFYHRIELWADEFVPKVGSILRPDFIISINKLMPKVQKGLPLFS